MKTTKLLIISLALALLFPLKGFAQGEELLEKPEWFGQLEDIEHINYYDMLNKWEAFKKANPRANVKNRYTKQVIKHFERWQKRYAPFVKADGRIVLPKQSDFEDFVATMNSPREQFRSNTLDKNVMPWEVFAPMITYNYKTKKQTPAQSNVQRLGISYSDPNVLYAGTETGMIFKSVDKGMNWEATPKDFYFGGLISSLEVSRTNPNKVVASAGSILWLSTNGGKTWENITPAKHKFDIKKWREWHHPYRNQFSHIKDAIFDPLNDNTILMGNDAGIYKTTDNGQTWTMVDNGQCFDIKWRANEGREVFALVKKGLQEGVVLRKSTNEGASFQTMAFTGFDNKAMSSGRIAISDEANAKGYVYVWGCQNDGTQKTEPRWIDGTPTLFKSKDNGATWEVNTSLPSKVQPWDKKGAFGYYAMVIDIRPDNPESIIFGLINLYTSDDGGQTIKSVGGYVSDFGFDLHSDQQDLHMVGQEAWLSTDGGVIHSSDYFRSNAETKVRGIYASEMWGFDMGWNEDIMVGGRNHNGNMAHLDRYGGNTIHMDGTEVSTGYVFLSNPRKINFSDLNPYGFIMPDDWKAEVGTFQNSSFPFENSKYGIGLKFDPRYAQSFYMNQQFDNKLSLWKTVDDGKSFVALHTFNEPISAYAVSRSNPDKLVVGTLAKIYYSLDGGQTFKEYSKLPELLNNTQNYFIEIHPRDENEIWVGTDNADGIFRTKDNGETWEHLNKGLDYPESKEKAVLLRFFLTGNEKNGAYGIGYVLRSEDEMYKNDESRIYYIDDTTNGWQLYSEGLPKTLMINRMLPFFKGGEIRLATKNGIWKRPLIDPDFKPVAQPIILSYGEAKNKGEAEIQFDSYSIVNQKDATWEWTFKPEPLSVSDAKVRNPKVRIAGDQTYDVTLKITTPKGTDSKTIKGMIKGSKAVPQEEQKPSSIIGQERLQRDVLLYPNTLARGESIYLAPHGLSEDFVIKVYNMQGKVIEERHLSAQDKHKFSTATYQSGTYVYLIQSNNFKKIGKFILR